MHGFHRYFASITLMLAIGTAAHAQQPAPGAPPVPVPARAPVPAAPPPAAVAPPPAAVAPPPAAVAPAPAPVPAAVVPAPAPVPAAAVPAPVAPGAVAATVNGQAIPEVAVQRALKAVPKDKQAEARPEILNFLVDNMLIEQWLAAAKIEVDPKDIEGQVEEMKKQLAKQKQDFAAMLKEMDMTDAEMRSHIAAELRWQKYVNTQANDQVLREMFDKSPDMFDGSMVHARHILLTPAPDVKAMEQAKQQLLAWRKQIEDQVAAGMAKLPATTDNLAKEKARTQLMEEAFAAIAKDKSACPSAKQGGDVGFFPRSGSMVEPFARAAFALKPYQMTDVVTTQFGLHLILVVARQDGKPGTKFEDAKEDVREVFAGRLRENVLLQLRQKAQIAMK